MSHYSEEDLIAFHLNEPIAGLSAQESARQDAALRTHLDSCTACCELSESIAETLRVFSAAPVPLPSPDDFDRNWHRLRNNLRDLSTSQPSARPRRFLRFLPTLGLATAALVVVAALFGTRIHLPVFPAATRDLSFHHRPGPLTTQPVASPDPTIASHLDRAERLLTEVNHVSGPLDPATRTQAHDLLLKNAVYVRSATDHGDLGQAAILEDLGRVLTTLDNEPPTPQSTLRLRVEMNTSGLLLDLRILRQNNPGS